MSVSRVRVRVNQTAAGVGEHGQVFTCDDGPLLRGMVRHGVVTVLSTSSNDDEDEAGHMVSGRLDTNPDETDEIEPDGPVEPGPVDLDGDDPHTTDSEGGEPG